MQSSAAKQSTFLAKAERTKALSCHICMSAQVAARAQRASVEPAEVVRYERYDQKHGAQYAADVMAAMDEEDW